MDGKSLLGKLAKTSVEKEVENLFNKFLGITEKLRYIANSDGLAGDKLFEYKFEANFSTDGIWRKNSYKALAQSIYYLKKISDMKVEQVYRLPSLIVIIDKSGGFIVPSQMVERIVGDNERGLEVDWLRASSSPDTVLIDWLIQKDFFKAFSINYYDFKIPGVLENFRQAIQTSKVQPAKIEINENNFVSIFSVWKSLFCETEKDQRQVADNYVLDINLKFEFLEKRDILINIENNRTWKVPREKYELFWSYFKRPPSAQVQQHILAHKDCLYDWQVRNDTGDFYTPIEIAKIANRYISEYLNLEKRISATWWDPAAGGANLFIESPNRENVILSTLEKTDYGTLKTIAPFKRSVIERFNFLKDKIPATIDKKLKAYDRPLIFLLNPPFNNQTGHSKGKDEDPNNVGSDFIQMQDSSEISMRDIRSAFSRFMYRIDKICEEYEYEDDVIVGIFSTTTWINGEDSEEFYKYWVRRYDFIKGFLVPSKLFRGTKGDWPVMFGMWQRKKKADFDLKQTHLRLDIFDENLEKVGVKDYVPFCGSVVKLKDFINKDIFRKQEKIPTIPLKNEYQVYDKGEPYIDYMYKGGLGYLRTIANDVQNSSGKLILLSRPYGGDNHNGLTITKENFESCLMVYGIRKSVKENWINHKDEFLIPSNVIEQAKFQNLKRKAILWSILDGGYTSALGEIKYKNRKERVFNEFFALEIGFLRKQRNISIGDIPDQNSFASLWIKQNKDYFTATEKEAMKAYEDFISASFNSGSRKFAAKNRFVNMPDASPRQLINGLYSAVESHHFTKEELECVKIYRSSVAKLKQDISQRVYELGILSNTKVFVDEEVEAIEATPVKIEVNSDESSKTAATQKTKRLFSKDELDEIVEKRTALSAYILNSLDGDKNLMRTKLAKILYTCDMEITHDLGTNYLRDAAGPLDKDLIYSKKVGVEALGSKNEIFETKETGKNIRYKIGKNAKSYSSRAQKIFKLELASIDKVVEIYRPLNTEQAEIVATIYACWNDFIIDGVKPTDEQIIQEFREKWHDKKKRFAPKRIEDAITWMRKKKLTPKGIKGHTAVKKEKKKSDDDDVPF